MRAAALLAALAVAVTGCSGGGDDASTSQAPTDGVLRLGFLNDPGQPPDPDIYYAGAGLAITTNVYEGLVRYEAGNSTEAEIVPLLAESWEVSDDNSQYTFHLREGVTFHDGTPFTADAVEASIQRRLDVDGGPAYMVSDVAQVDTIDDYTVTITLSAPNSAFLDYLASPYGLRMISPTILSEQAGDDYAQTYLSTHDGGTGPYTLTKAEVDSGYELQAYDGYWGDEEPTFTTIDMPVYTEVSAMQLALEKGDLHAMLGQIPNASREGYVNSDALSAYTLPSFQVGVFYMNPNRELLADESARKALFEGIDWATLIDQTVMYSGKPSEGNYPEGALPADVDSRELVYDPDALQEWVSSLPAGTAIDIGYTAGSSDAEQMSNLIAAQLQALGMNATAASHQTSEIYGSFASDPANAPDVFVSPGTWPDSNNAYMHGHVFWDADGGLNYLQCSSEDVTSLLTEALRTGDAETYAQAGDAAYEHMCNPTFAWISDFMVAQPWLAGVEDAHNIAAPYTLDFNKLSIA
ncbi:hypothetical protein GCM10009785_23630 [Brooklawnia cerclae]|uniref:Peptide/nickel transport system substrate-binding protein n=1 Tax=Brooklawnia cerclae TaxID=349934 RepID=A0ABX0SB93_9ACTN|nr:ABC transporter substrate-binding protein [Brooklawnia cerclae]NIH55670.1 peptide/nickel transport system substrate-binding protein [Brooklawnia cerclae]